MRVGRRRPSRTSSLVGATWFAAAVVVLLLLPVAPHAALGTPHSVPQSSPSGNRAAVTAPSPPHAVVPRSGAYDWPELHQTPSLGGYASNSILSTTTASGLGVVWATYLYGAALDSPVAAYDPALGETLAYIGTEAGDVLAVDVATGQIVWGVWLGSPIRSSPLVYNTSVFVATVTNPSIVRLNATTGVEICSVPSARPLEGTPTLGTPRGGVATLYVGSEDSNTATGALEAINAANCSAEWSFTGFRHRTGSWTPAAFGVTANGTPLVLFGTADTDAGVYAVNALTGTIVWRFQSYNPPPAVYDIGAGVTVSRPGKNGFSQGVAYVPSKYGIMYALALNTGTPIWSTNYDQLAAIPNGTDGGRSTAALDGTNLIFGYNEGLFNLNAKTGHEIWNYADPAREEAIASPAVAGGNGTAVVAVGDISGGVEVLSVVGGTSLYHYQTGGYITASPAVVGGNLLVASTDGFLYDFAHGGGNSAVLPDCSISYPVQSATLANPNGNLTLAGNATGPTSLAAVEVAIQSGGPNGPWWAGSVRAWVAGPFENAATLASPGANASSWSYAMPAAAAGGSYRVIAYALSATGQAGPNVSEVAFAVLYSTHGPHLRASSSFVAPGAREEVNGGGFRANETVLLTLAGATLATVNASRNGSLPATSVKIPTHSLFGGTSLTATGQSSGRVANAAITVENSWDQFLFDPGHAGYEPNDQVLNFLVNPGHYNWVRPVWHFTPGSAINSSPSVVDGVAYVGDTAGSLYAVDTHNGGLLWNWTIPSGRPLDGSPAVDASQGLVVVGADDGTVDAVHLSNGTSAWSTSVGGNVSAPLRASGELYVTTSAGRVVALNESTGNISWSKTLPSSVSAAPALNVRKDLLVVGQSDGNVTELNGSTGSLIWNYQTAGAVRASPTVSGGVVYVGSDDKNVYALSMASGAKIWSYATGGRVDDTGALSVTHSFRPGQLELAIGASDGKLYVLQVSNGSLDYTIAIRGSIVGVAAAYGVFVMETSKGLLSATRSYTSLDVWKYQTAGPLASSPVIVDGAIYVGAGDGSLYAFTTFGQPPS